MLDYHKLADEKHGFLNKPLRLSWGRLGVVLACLGVVLGPSWAVLDILGPSWGRLGAILGCSGPSWGRL